MPKALRTIVLLAGLLLLARSEAQQTAVIGKQVPDVKVELKGSRQGKKDHFFFRELRGSIVLVYFWRSTNTASVELLSQIKELYREFGNKGVRFISVTVDKQDTNKKVLDEKDAHFFRWEVFEGTLLHHMLGGLSEPYVVLIDPNGILAWRGVPDERLRERLADLHARTRPPAGDNDWLERHFRQAKRLYDQGEYGRAFWLSRLLFKITDEAHPVHGKAEALMAKCETAAENWLKEAVQAERAGKLEEAARIVADIAVRFEDPDEDKDQRGQSGGSRDERKQSVKHQAELEIGRMSGDRELKKLIREARENAEAELLNDQAALLEEDGYYLKARQIYEQVLEKYEERQAAREAKRRLRRIERDPEIQRKVAEHRATEEAFRWLDLGDRFAQLGLYAEARRYYQNIISDHPQTLAAERARQRLSELPEETSSAASAMPAGDQP